MTKAYEEQSPPQGVTLPSTEQKDAPWCQAFCKTPMTLPTTWPADDILSKSDLFTAPPTSPTWSKGRFQEISTRQMPVRSSTYEAWQPAVATAAPKLTSTAEASRRPLKHARTSLIYKSDTGKSHPTPILNASVQDTDYDFIDLASPEASPPTAASSLSSRRFSFDANAPADWELIQIPSRQPAPAPGRTPTPPPKDMTPRTSLSPTDELYFTRLPPSARMPKPRNP